MKLAEALMKRKTLRGELVQTYEELSSNMTYVEGDEVDTQAAHEKFWSLPVKAREIEKLTIQINLTNNTATLKNGLTIMQAIARRDTLLQLDNWLRMLSQANQYMHRRTTKDQLRVLPVLDRSLVQSQAEQLRESYTTLDLAIQQANWSVDLIEE